MIDRVEVVDHRGEPAALAGLPQRRARLPRAPARRLRGPRHPQRQARAQPHAPRHPDGPRAARRRSTLALFNMDHPVVGGYSADKVALRRAIALAYNVAATRSAWCASGQAIPAQIAGRAAGHRLRPGASADEMSTTTAAARQAPCSTLYGYVDRDGDGWRELPDGSPLVLEMATQPDQLSRQLDELWKKSMTAIGVRIDFKVGQVAREPAQGLARRQADDVAPGLERSAARRRHLPGAAATARTRGRPTTRASTCRPSTRCTTRQRAAARRPGARGRDPRGQEAASSRTCRTRLHVHRIATDLSGHPWVVGYRRHPFMRDFWKYVDIDTDRRCRTTHELEGFPVNAPAPRPPPHAAGARRGALRRHLPGVDAAVAQEANGQKVLRYAFEIAETGFDPAQITDLYSRVVTGPHLRDAVPATTTWRGRSRSGPARRPRCPRCRHDFRVWTIRLRPGIYFADDPVFKRQEARTRRRGLRLHLEADHGSALEGAEPASTVRAEGHRPERAARRALKDKTPFDYNTPIEGLRALDRYTLQFGSSEPRPRFLQHLAGGDLWGAVAREVVEATATRSPAHPVGTGPFRLAEWRRIVADRARAQPELPRGVLRRGAQRRRRRRPGAARRGSRAGALPMVDRVEISVIEEVAAALAVVPERAAGRASSACRRDFVDRAVPERQAGAEPGQATA